MLSLLMEERDFAGWPPHQSVEASLDVIKNVLSKPMRFVLRKTEKLSVLLS